MAARITFDDRLERLLIEAGDDLAKLQRIRDLAALQVRLAERRHTPKGAADGQGNTPKRDRSRPASKQQALVPQADEAK